MLEQHKIRHARKARKYNEKRRNERLCNNDKNPIYLPRQHLPFNDVRVRDEISLLERQPIR